MKRIINTLIIAAVSLLAFACQEHETLDLPMNESIVLRLFSGAVKAADTDAEAYVNHVDVFIFEDASGNPAAGGYYGRYEVKGNDRFTLDAKRSSFPAGSRYHVYLIANSNLPTSDFEVVESYADLVPMNQVDRNIHISGLTVADAPQYFLMDAAVRNVQLNNGVLSDNTDLTVTLERAAAKVFIKIEATDNIEFKPFDFSVGSDGGMYYIRNLPVDAFLLADAKPEEETVATLRQTDYSINQYFTWNPAADSKNVTLTAYVYPHHWTNSSLLEQETCVVMNLPLSYTDNGVVTDYHNSWYKIPMSGEKFFKRNNYYEVNIELNRPGATTETVPVDLTEIHYMVAEWTPKSIDVGGEDKPVYLMVNETEMSMRNISTDATTLEFASSSPVTVTIQDAHYFDKFGQKVRVPASVLNNMNGRTDGGIAGNITVNSPIPVNNAIRYFTLVVTNADNITKEVSVAQYPLEYITNQQGWYSYRSDFYTGSYRPTTYEYKGSRRVAANWSWGSWDYYTSAQNTAFFGSKVATMNSNGTSRLFYYSWSQNSNTVSTNAGNLTGLNNARMYHVQITSSSSKYIVSIPRQDADGFTDDGEDNALLVSPSFMIASQLGATQAPTSVEQAERHCREYVEVHDPDNNPATANAVHYDNWRLPTEAEIQIIIDFQYAPNAAMDEVLSGRSYWSATGAVRNPGSNDNGTQSAVRCIRDVY